MFEIAFDVNIDWHEFIEADDEWEAEELADRMLLNDAFYGYIIGKLKEELNKTPYIEASCVGGSTYPATITTEQVKHYLKEG